MSNRRTNASLDDLVALQTEKIFVNKDPKLPYVGLEHMAQGEPRLLGTANSSSSISVNAVFKKEDILFGKLRPNLRKSIKAPFDGYCSTDILVLRSQGGVVPEFSAHVFQWERVFSAAVATAAGTKMPRTSWSDLKRFKVFKPESDQEQTRIAYVLDTIDEAIAQTEAVIAKLKQVRAGMLHDLLSYGLDEHGQLRDPIAHPEQFQDSPLGLIPRGWDAMPLGMYCRRLGGSIQTGPFGSQLHASDYREVGIPIITVEHLDEGWIRHENLPLVDKVDYHRLYRYRLREGDLVFSRVGAVDRCSLISKNEDGWLFSGRCLRVRFDTRYCDPRFFLYQLNSHRCRRWILNNAVGSTMHCLNTQILSDLPIVIPDKLEQTRIAVSAFYIENNLTSLELELSKHRSLKSGLQDDLLTGRVRVPETIMEGAENE